MTDIFSPEKQLIPCVRNKSLSIHVPCLFLIGNRCWIFGSQSEASRGPKHPWVLANHLFSLLDHIQNPISPPIIGFCQPSSSFMPMSGHVNTLDPSRQRPLTAPHQRHTRVQRNEPVPVDPRCPLTEAKKSWNRKVRGTLSFKPLGVVGANTLGRPRWP